MRSVFATSSGPPEMTNRPSYFQRLAAPLGTKPGLYPLAQAAPGEARPQAAVPSVTRPGGLPSTPAPALPASTIRRQQAASAVQKTAARRGQSAIAVTRPGTRPEKATPELPAVAAMPKAGARAANEALEPEIFLPVQPEAFTVAVAAIPFAAPIANHSDTGSHATKPAMAPRVSPAQPELIWGEPIAYCRKNPSRLPPSSRRRIILCRSAKTAVQKSISEPSRCARRQPRQKPRCRRRHPRHGRQRRQQAHRFPAPMAGVSA